MAVKCLCYTCRMYWIQYFESAELKLLLWKIIIILYFHIFKKLCHFVLFSYYFNLLSFFLSFSFLVISFPEYLLYWRSETKLLSFTGKFQTFHLFHIWQIWVLFHCFRSIQGEQKCVHNTLSIMFQWWKVHSLSWIFLWLKRILDYPSPKNQ